MVKQEGRKQGSTGSRKVSVSPPTRTLSDSTRKLQLRTRIWRSSLNAKLTLCHYLISDAFARSSFSTTTKHHLDRGFLCSTSIIMTS